MLERLTHPDQVSFPEFWTHCVRSRPGPGLLTLSGLEQLTKGFFLLEPALAFYGHAHEILLGQLLYPCEQGAEFEFALGLPSLEAVQGGLLLE